MILTDHMPLVGLNKLKLTKEPTGHLDRWCLELGLYICEVINSSGNVRLLERIAVDILGGLPKSDSGNVVIMVITDCLTKSITAYLLPDHKAKIAAESLV